MRRCHSIRFAFVAALFAVSASAQTADLLVSKSAPESVSAGDTIDYSIFVFNSGPSAAQNVTVTDTLPFATTFVSLNASTSLFNCTAPPAGSGGTVTCTAASFADETETSFTIRVKTSPSAPSGSISNTATITSATSDPNTSDNSSTVTTGIAATSTASADLSIDSMASSTNAAAGATMSFQVVIANKGPSSAHHVELVDAVPANATFIAASVSDPVGAFTCSTPAVGTAGNINCTAAAFDPRSSSERPVFTFTFRINNGVAAGTALTNSASLSADEADPIPSNNTASRTTAVTTQAGSADLSVATVGGSTSFSVTVTNAGPNDATGVTLTDTVPSGSTFVSWTQTRGPQLNCSTPPSGGTGSITCTAAVFPGVEGTATTAAFDLALDTTSQVTNNVTVSSSTVDPRPDNNSSSYPVLATLSVEDVTVIEGDSGVTPASFTVRLTPANALLTATVDYNVSAISATPGVDFAPAQGTLTFRAGETQKTITVQVFGDVVPETDETFTVQLSNAINAALGRAAALGTIADDDHGAPPIPFASIADVSVTEGNSGLSQATFTMRLSIPSANLSRVRFQTQDVTATAGSDYLPLTAEITFQPGETVKTFTIPIIGDVVYEPDESFRIVITGTDNATFGTSPATCTIANDDAQVPPRHRSVRH
jgi:uncharacterized repeat protein (TIGR01451 family)